jgi:toxin YoeB
MNDVSFSPIAMKDYMEWQTEDRKTLKKINDLIKDIQRNGPAKGIGKPELLKHMKAYSRRIDEVNRLVYSADENQNLYIISCKGHYV